MDLYLPIAGLSVNAIFVVALGGMVGLLTGMVGVGGGFLITPILIFYGIPPSVAVASATTQITGTSISGVLAHRRRGGVDYRMGAIIIGGGIVGALLGGFLFSLLQSVGQIDTVVSILYVLLLGSIGLLMAQGGRDRPRHPEAARGQAAAPATQSAGRGAAVPLALLSLRPLHLAAGAVPARLFSPAC